MHLEQFAATTASKTSQFIRSSNIFTKLQPALTTTSSSLVIALICLGQPSPVSAGLTSQLQQTAVILWASVRHKHTNKQNRININVNILSCS